MSGTPTVNLSDVVDVIRRFNLPAIYWERVGDDPNEWKGPHEKGWNDPSRVYDLAAFNPDRHNLGWPTGREIAPGRFIHDFDIDRLNPRFARAFLPSSLLALCRPGKPLSHIFVTLPEAVDGRVQWKGPDKTPYIELRGARHQTMAPPSLHTPPDQRVEFVTAADIRHLDSIEAAKKASLHYALACLTDEFFPGGLHHDDRVALAGVLLKRGFDPKDVERLLQTICEDQMERGVASMSEYDITDSAKVVASTVERLERKERVKGWSALKEANDTFAKHLARWLRPQGAVTPDDFYAYLPGHRYLFTPTGELWPASGVNGRIRPVNVGTEDEPEYISASAWLDRHRSVEQMTWAPGQPTLIANRLVADGGWIERSGCSTFNLYRPPTITRGDARQATRWRELIEKLYPEHAEHIVCWFAQRVQRPHEKLNHALVLGGAPGIGKDTIIEPVKHAIGPWNFAEVSPIQLLGRFNGFLKSVILRVSEARDLGELDRYGLYEHTKTYTAAPPDVLRVDEKNTREYSIFNVVGVLYTTNHETQGLYIPADDRRHFVTWSTVEAKDFPDGYWRDLYRWYASGGHGHVAAYLASYDLSKFDAKAPPPKTEAFRNMVDANRSTEDAELADVLDAMGNPPAVILDQLVKKAQDTKVLYFELAMWLQDRKNARQVPHRMKTAGYVAHRQQSAKDGLWVVNGKRKTIYVKADLSTVERDTAAQDLTKELSKKPDA